MLGIGGRCHRAAGKTSVPMLDGRTRQKQSRFKESRASTYLRLLQAMALHCY
jgi:hypothetical protein